MDIDIFPIILLEVISMAAYMARNLSFQLVTIEWRYVNCPKKIINILKLYNCYKYGKRPVSTKIKFRSLKYYSNSLSSRFLYQPLSQAYPHNACWQYMDVMLKIAIVASG